jgi:mRNA-degrading endonuclease RelE of RelBE toxin-antitoxin system
VLARKSVAQRFTPSTPTLSEKVKRLSIMMSYGAAARVGRYRLIFCVDKKERTVFVTHLGKRESIYES